MKRLRWAAAACCLASIQIADAGAALVRAAVQPTRHNCAAFGDALCAGGQVLGDPALAPLFDTVSGATPSSLAVADKSYIDPRLGTANSTSGSASARLGVLRAQSASSVSSQPPLATGSVNLMQLSTFSTALFEDTITVMPSASGLIGAAGFLTASIRVSGLLNASAVGTQTPSTSLDPLVAYADWRLQVGVGSTILGNVNSPVAGFFGAEGVNNAGLIAITSAGETALVTFTAPVTLGSPTPIQIVFGAATTVNLAAAVVRPLTSGFTLGSAESIYVSTAYWNGVQSVRSGATPIDFSITSLSGIDYALPVPEPHSVLLFIAGIAVLIGRMRASGRRS